MATHDYYATYCRFSARTKAEAALLLGADCCIGDTLEVQAEDHELDPEACLVNRFGKTVGHLNSEMTQQVLLVRARGWQVRALLASLYYTEPEKREASARTEDDATGYWGEIVIISFPDSPALRAFCDTVSRALGEGIRPNVELGASGVEQVVASQGAWLPEGRTPKPDLGKGAAVVKDHLTLNEKIVEQARRRNPGCMAAGWAFIIIAIAAVIWLLVRMFA